MTARTKTKGKAPLLSVLIFCMLTVAALVLSAPLMGCDNPSSGDNAGGNNLVNENNHENRVEEVDCPGGCGEKVESKGAHWINCAGKEHFWCVDHYRCYECGGYYCDLSKGDHAYLNCNVHRICKHSGETHSTKLSCGNYLCQENHRICGYCQKCKCTGSHGDNICNKETPAAVKCPNNCGTSVTKADQHLLTCGTAEKPHYTCDGLKHGKCVNEDCDKPLCQHVVCEHCGMEGLCGPNIETAMPHYRSNPCGIHYECEDVIGCYKYCVDCGKYAACTKDKVHQYIPATPFPCECVYCESPDNPAKHGQCNFCNECIAVGTHGVCNLCGKCTGDGYSHGACEFCTECTSSGDHGDGVCNQASETPEEQQPAENPEEQQPAENTENTEDTENTEEQQTADPAAQYLIFSEKTLYVFQYMSPSKNAA